MEVYIVTNTDHSLPPEQLVDKLKSDINVTSIDLVSRTLPGTLSLIDWCLMTCRSHKKLTRKLLLQQTDFTVVLRLLLTASNRELTGDGEFIVSDLIELEGKVNRAREKGEWPVGQEGDIVGQAAAGYKKFLSDRSLFDQWEVVQETVKCLEGEKRILVLWGLGDELGLVKQFKCSSVNKIEVSNGDIMVEGVVDVCEIDCDDDLVSEDEKISSDSDLMTIVSFLRLLVCSRDELSLAKVMTASKLLTPDQLNKVRKEAVKVKMPLYQTIVSWVIKVGLGGASYQPDEDSGLYEFRPSLVEFNDLMEKLQTKLEEVEGPENAVKAVINSVKVWLVKKGLSVDTNMDILVKEVSDRVSKEVSTPARGLAGRPAVKLLIGLSDLVSSMSMGTKELVGTPARRETNVVQYLQTPQQQTLDPEDELDNLVAQPGLADRIGDSENMTPVARKVPAYPRFRSAMAEAFLEGSPALVASAERKTGVRTGGCTLMVGGKEDLEEEEMSVENTRRILQEVKDNEEIEEVNKPTKLKTKRCLAKEVDSIVRDKMGLTSNSKRKSGDDEKSKPKPAKKKKFSTPKGQKKMTSFFSK